MYRVAAGTCYALEVSKLLLLFLSHSHCYHPLLRFAPQILNMFTIHFPCKRKGWSRRAVISAESRFHERGGKNDMFAALPLSLAAPLRSVYMHFANLNEGSYGLRHIWSYRCMELSKGRMPLRWLTWACCKAITSH